MIFLKQTSLILVSFLIIFIKFVSSNTESLQEPPLPPIEEISVNSPNVDIPLENNDDEVNNLPNYVDLNETITANVSDLNKTDIKNATERFAACIPTYGDPKIELVNGTELIKLLSSDPNVTNKETPGNCMVIMFYSKYCPFSSMAAPHFNALPRAFPTMKMVAINAMWYHIFNAQNGVIGVPAILLFHNGKPVAKFNDSDYTLELFSRFVSQHTGIPAEEKSFVTSADFSGPVVSVPSKDDDIFLIISWVFLILCILYYFGKSRFWVWIVETVQNTWRESEAQAQHQHGD